MNGTDYGRWFAQSNSFSGIFKVVSFWVINTSFVIWPCCWIIEPCTVMRLNNDSYFNFRTAAQTPFPFQLYEMLNLDCNQPLNWWWLLLQICMAMSAGYHTFCCHSKDSYHCWLSYDLCGISFSLLAIYITGIYYAFWCHDVIITIFYLFLNVWFRLVLSMLNYSYCSCCSYQFWCHCLLFRLVYCQLGDFDCPNV